MKTGTRIAALLALGLVLFGGTWMTRAEEESALAPWDEQLVELGYRLYCNSSVNVIYGLNLTVEQAKELQTLARQVEAAGYRAPRYRGRLAPEVVEVAETFLTVQKLLLAKKEIPDSLSERLLESRTLEARFLREGLTAPVRGEKYGSCRRCHAEPEVVDGKITYHHREGKWEAMGRRAKSEAVKKEMGFAHLAVILRDRDGFVFMYGMGEKVAKVLSDAQREVVGEFSCCLVPPQSMSDAVRVGQADATGHQVELLEKVRQCPEAWWPTVKERVLDRLEGYAVATDPGLTRVKLASERVRIAAVLSEARELSDVDFELEKERLASEIRLAAPVAPDRLKNLNAAFFLLLPGSVEVYDRLLGHLEREGVLRDGGR